MKRVACLLLIVLCCVAPLFSEGRMRVIFPRLVSDDIADSLHGDCAILITDDGYTMMVDCGHPNTASSMLEALRVLGITHLDCFVATHQHVDHIGAFPALADSVSIDTVYQSTVEYPSTTRVAFSKALETHDIPSLYVSSGDVIKEDGQFKISVLWPEREVPLPDPISNSFTNNNSVVLKVQYQGTSLLLAGDLYTMGERQVMVKFPEGELDADIAKANHHGQDTSNQKTWFKTVSPDLVVCTNDGAFDPVIFTRLKVMGIDILQTAIDGDIVITLSDGRYTATSGHLK